MGRFEQEYREALDGLRFSNAGKERIMKNLIEQAAGTPVKRRGARPLRTALIAAALCAGLVGTAFAASPGLREMLAQALGGFAPYAQEQEDKAYVIDGIEFKVKAVLADNFTIRAYVEARDVDGDIFDRIDDITIPGRVGGGVNVPFLREWMAPDATESWTSGVTCLSYDEENRTALLVASTWKAMPEDFTGAEVEMLYIQSYLTGDFGFAWENTRRTTIPVEVKQVESTVLGKDSTLVSGLSAEEARLSPLGLTLIFRDTTIHREAVEGVDIRVKLMDGSMVTAPQDGWCNIFLPPYDENSARVLIWNFREPVEAEQIAGIYVGEDYFPIG